MKRIHIHVTVDNFFENIRFYSAIFGVPPSVVHEDYAKWEMHNPAVNFAISRCGDSAGINHLGIQVESENELAEIKQGLDSVGIASSSQQGASCCYARSNKYWALDPQGIAWESFFSLSHTPVFGEGAIVDGKDKLLGCP